MELLDTLQLSARRYGRLARGALLHDQPVYAHFGITHRCDITCRMCGIWKYGNEDEELGLPQIARMADVLQELGVAQLAIGGGEPFTRRDLAEVVALFKSRNLSVRVVTNAMNVDEKRIREVADAGLDAVSISLDSLNKQRFGWICMDPDAWEKVVTNMVRFGEALAGRGSPLVMNTVVSKANLLELPELVQFADQLGFFISLIPVELAEDPRDRSNKFITHQPKLELSQEELAQLDEIYDRVIQLKAGGAPILSTTAYLMASRRYFKTGAFPLPCDAGRLYFSVNPAGMMTICHRGQDKKSMLDADVVSYFRSELYQQEAHAEASACEGCVRPCWIDTSFMFKTMQGFFEGLELTLQARQPRARMSLVQALACGQ
ncbi:MAG: radical SAM protein [Myxococcota bacterium]